jgi:hypothetical protein
MPHRRLPTAAALLLAAIFLATPFLTTPFAAAQNAPAKIAGMEQDIAILRDEIQKLREEVQDLRAALDRERAAHKNAVTPAFVQTQITTANAANAAERRALEDRANTRIKALGEAVNKEFAKLDARPARPTTPPPKPPPGPPGAPPPGMPTNAIKYTIKSGDNPAKIARAHKSKVEWIFYVNEGLSAKNLKVGLTILVPTPEAAPPPPPAAQ